MKVIEINQECYIVSEIQSQEILRISIQDMFIVNWANITKVPTEQVSKVQDELSTDQDSSEEHWLEKSMSVSDTKLVWEENAQNSGDSNAEGIIQNKTRKLDKWKQHQEAVV